MNTMKDISNVVLFLERTCHYGYVGIKGSDLPR